MPGHDSEEREGASDAETAAAWRGISEDSTVGASAAEPNIDDVIAKLDTTDPKLPKDALRDAQRLRPQIVPRLIQLIERAAEMARSGQSVRTSGAFFALYLLGEFRAKEALPAILDAMRLPPEADLFGDAISMDFNRILAVLAVDDPEALERLIADKEANVYGRWEAANTYMFWVRDGLMTREAAVERLRQHLTDAMHERNTELVAALVCCLGNLGGVEAKHQVKEAFQRDLVDLHIVDQHFIDEQLANAEESFRSELEECPPSGISDTVEHLSHWYCFREPEPPGPSLERVPPPPRPPREPEPRHQSDALRAPLSPIRHEQPHVGRNDPCPCGSGKKYKKCCALKA